MRESTETSAFQSAAWLIPWFVHFAKPHGVYVAVARAGDTILGIAPFGRTRLGVGPAAFDLLVSAGTEHGDYGEPLLGADPEPVAAAFTDHLVQQVRTGKTVVNARRLIDGAPMLQALNERDDVRLVPMGTEADAGIVSLDALDDPAAFLARQAKKRKLHVMLKRLEAEIGPCTFHAHDPDPLAALAAMERFLRERWAPGEGPKIFSTPTRRAFAIESTLALVESGMGRISTFRSKDDILAAYVVHTPSRRWLADTAGYDTGLNRFSLGHLTLHLVLVQALAEGASEVDLRAGDFPYKYRWSNTTRRSRSVALVRTGAIGSAQLGLRRAAMSIRARSLDGSAEPASVAGC